MQSNSNLERMRLRPPRLKEAPEHHCHFCPMAFYSAVSCSDHEQYRHRERNG